jgi:hypothetical protein
LAGGQQVVDPATGTPIQQDRSGPVYGLWRPLPGLPQPVVQDGYRIPIPAELLAQVDGILVIAYTQNADGSFTNLLEYRHLPTPSVPFPGQ